MKYLAKEPSRLEVYLFAKMPSTSFPLCNYYFILERHFTECRNLGCLDNPRLRISPSSLSRVTLPTICLWCFLIVYLTTCAFHCLIHCRTIALIFSWNSNGFLRFVWIFNFSSLRKKLIRSTTATKIRARYSRPVAQSLQFYKYLSNWRFNFLFKQVYSWTPRFLCDLCSGIRSGHTVSELYSIVTSSLDSRRRRRPYKEPMVLPREVNIHSTLDSAWMAFTNWVGGQGSNRVWRYTYGLGRVVLAWHCTKSYCLQIGRRS